jgi:hypothetical protein
MTILGGGIFNRNYGEISTGVDNKAKDPKSTQAQLRHADPTITLKLYQKSVPESVKAAAISFEADLLRQNSVGVLRGQPIQ